MLKYPGRGPRYSRRDAVGVCPRLLSSCSAGAGVDRLGRLSMDRALLLGARGLRAFGFGFAAVLIGVHLERRGLSAGLIGLTVGLGLAAASLSGLASAGLAARVEQS